MLPQADPMPSSPSMCSSGAWSRQVQPPRRPLKTLQQSCTTKTPPALPGRATRWKSWWRRTWCLLILQVSGPAFVVVSGTAAGTSVHTVLHLLCLTQLACSRKATAQLLAVNSRLCPHGHIGRSNGHINAIKCKYKVISQHDCKLLKFEW